MSNMLEHRGYLGSVLYSDEDQAFHGRLEFMRDLVSYEGSDAKSLKSAFQEAVDDYLRLCESYQMRRHLCAAGAHSASRTMNRASWACWK